jgi:hypothetical protein
MDWRVDTWDRPGEVLAISGWNANNLLLRINGIGGKKQLRLTDYADGKQAWWTPEGQYRANEWYRFTVTGKVGAPIYHVKMVERGKNNQADGEVVFDSAAEGRTQHVNPDVEDVAMLTTGVWKGQGDKGYAYLIDNVTFTSSDSAQGGAEAPGEPGEPQ